LLFASGVDGHFRSTCTIASHPIAFPRPPKPFWPPDGNLNLGAGVTANSRFIDRGGGSGSFVASIIVVRAFLVFSYLG
jgi:tRNA A58 N-methylase Trm61